MCCLILLRNQVFERNQRKEELEKTAWVLDVSTAFLHAPVIHPAVVSLPTGMEDEDGEPLFVILEKAMNGLRSAGMSWYRHLADLIRSRRFDSMCDGKDNLRRKIQKRSCRDGRGESLDRFDVR